MVRNTKIGGEIYNIKLGATIRLEKLSCLNFHVQKL